MVEHKGEIGHRIMRAFSVPAVVMGPPSPPENPLLSLYYRGGFGDVGSWEARRAVLQAMKRSGS